MSNKIQRYLQGDFEYEGGSLIFSCSKIEINTSEKQDCSGSFFIEERSGKKFRGKIFSSDLSMECLNQEFEGIRVEVRYKTSIQSRVGGDVRKGEFYIITDIGEYVIPYVINVTYESIESSLGAIKNLFHFANLAKCNWKEAIELFYLEDFIKILSGNDRKYRSLYKGLVVSGNPNHNLEEFLVCIHKKQKIDYRFEREEIQLVNPGRTDVQTIRIHLSGWGYVRLKVEKNAEFIVLERTRLTSADFSSDICEYQFFIDPSLLHEGNNYGSIIFEHAYGKSVIQLNIVSKTKEYSHDSERQQKKSFFRITRTYLDFQLRRISMTKCIAQMKESLLHLQNLSLQIVEPILMEAHLMITQGNYNEAKWVLDHGVGNVDGLNDENYCYYLYLTVLYSADEYYAMEIADQIRSIYKKNESNWRIAWIYMNLSPDLNKNAFEKWTFGIEQMLRGCNSPVLYIDILKELNRQPSLLGYFDIVHLRLIYFGAKNNYLSAELCHQIVSVSNRTKEYQVLLFKTLELIYEKRPDDDTLQAICILLMKGERMDSVSHNYYTLGVEYQLSITRLYEYYILSIDTEQEEEIPKSVLMYFSYECNLPTQYAAYIYAYIYANRDKYSELYEIYQSQIERFVVTQLEKQNINSKLAYLYEELLLHNSVKPDFIRMFAAIMFMNCITIEDDAIVAVIVMDERLKNEKIYPVLKHKTYIMLYGNEYTILLEDREGRRFASNKNYQIERFFLPRKFLPIIEPFVKENLAFSLFKAGGYQEYFAVTKENVEQFSYLERIEAIEDEYRYNIRMSLIHYYFEQDEVTVLNELLERTEASQIPMKFRNDFIQILSICGYMKKAYDLIIEFGPENINPKTLVKVCSYMVEQMSDYGDEKLLRIIYSSFERGKYNDIVLLYLVKFFNGTVKLMRNIWQAAFNFDIDTYSICERILSQIVETTAFIGEEEEIFKAYVRSSPKMDIEMAYLSHVCFEYMVFDRVSKTYIFDQLECLFFQKEKIPVVCMIAYLKFHSDHVETLNMDQRKICRKFIEDLYCDKKIVFPFLTKYAAISVEAEIISHFLYISYKGNPKSNVVIHYIISRDNSEEGEYVKERMVNMFGGIFVKTFVLFFGESLQYYITEEYANKEQLTESGTLQNSDALPGEESSRYTMVNDIAMATTLKDYVAAKELIDEYSEKEFLVKSLFSLQ